ncbi:TetR/AcrR family transcriptional regulator [Oleomonas cavernae]|uniref:TetR/AcrR family transcriptional regulator n=1 Tax=Oleomonas cavernae TaxID=2320859 RepID=A0A418W9L7_9PROT|nr:TetR/AcrR family transcriptional regulator [Oleomonas cavernae]RJF86634.1 TetR/AcrR family transcriptional regulator [Oleomonas cavernae]
MARKAGPLPSDRRGEILQAALHLFAERGFDGTSVRDIARAVGLNEGTLYHYFPGKEAIFAAILAERGYGAAQVDLDLGPGPRSLAEMLGQVGRHFLQALRENAPLTAVLLRESIRHPPALSEPGKGLQALIESRARRLARLFAQGAPPASRPVTPDFAAGQFFGSLATFWIAETFIAGHTVSVDEAEAHLRQLVAATLAALGEGPNAMRNNDNEEETP